MEADVSMAAGQSSRWTHSFNILRARRKKLSYQQGSNVHESDRILPRSESPGGAVVYLVI